MDYMHLLCLFFQGIRCFSHLRNFKTLRPLIRMIIEVIGDMPPFSLIMISSIVFFAVLQEKMGQIHERADEDLTFMEQILVAFKLVVLQEYLYQMASDIHYIPKLYLFSWIIFIIACIFQIIIMLNLLIAVISETYDRVMESLLCFEY